MLQRAKLEQNKSLQNIFIKISEKLRRKIDKGKQTNNNKNTNKKQNKLKVISYPHFSK